MTAFLSSIQRLRRIGPRSRKPEASRNTVRKEDWNATPSPITIAPDDPIVAYFLSMPGAIEIAKLHLDSPALRDLKSAGVTITIPLVSQGELVGLLNLGPRLSQQEYSTDDRRLLNTLATQAAPAVRVAQMVRQQRVEARERERIEQELRIARLIQQTLLPKELPSVQGWQFAAYYQPARAVGGDFYDFLYFDDGRLGIVIGDVTDKGVPAALVMATTRSILRTAAQAGDTPGIVLEQANNLLCPDIPPKMFVTCLYAILDPRTGRIHYANAGHDLPYQRHSEGASVLRATGMPLGLMPGMRYEEKETYLKEGDSVLFYSDGLIEAHNPARDMFGFPRLMTLMSDSADSVPLIERMLNELASFTGSDWEQEDDVTLVALQRKVAPENKATPSKLPEASDNTSNDGWHTLESFDLPSEPGNERQAMRKVGDALQHLDLSPKRIEQLKTAVAEATMNAMEHGNHYQTDLPVQIRVLASETCVAVRISDRGQNADIPDPQTPNLEAKLSELQTPRGWGLFLIKNLVDDMRVTTDQNHHIVELIISREGDSHASQNA
ncbi:MAG: Serine phosphatase RsbU, regulator of sigma subunit [Ktedonobacterales bacterium]|jgi:serine phosphatase RsbU (regulator of sigma subunit)/anti-sigma regulatory factor (Ser/Thr protein kinase)|nr:MAG: Serine phosphatase RsbU, regulator of sigma subunit [Ktedonobacterales bacterium]